MEQTQIQNRKVQENQQVAQSSPQIYPSQSNIINERKITPEEFQEVINYACMLQKLEVEREENNKRSLEALAQFNQNEGIPLSLVAKVVDDVMHIGKPFVQEALDLYFPTPEQMQADISTLNAKPSRGVIYSIYKKHIQACINKSFPMRNIEVSAVRDSCSFSISVNLLELKEVEKRKFFKKKKEIVKEKKELGEIYQYWGCTPYGRIRAYSPLFLRACGETLKMLENKFECMKGIKYVYEYDPEQQ